MTLIRARPDVIAEPVGPVEEVEPVSSFDLRKFRTERSRDIQMRFLIVSAWAFAVVPRAIQTLTAPKYRVNIGAQAIPYSGLSHRAVTIVTVMIFASCLVPLMLSLRDIRTSGRIALAAYLLPWVYMIFRGLYQGHHIARAQYVYALVGLGVWALRPKWKSLALMGYLAGATALLALFMGLAMPAKGIYQAAGGTNITADKQIFSSGILVGPFTNGNNLGQFLVMGTACAMMIKNLYWRVTMIAASGLALVWSSARSEILTYLALAVVFLIIRFTPIRARGVAAFGILSGLVGLVVYLPLTTKDPLAFTNRGYIWTVSLQYWDTHKWGGLGEDFYQEIASKSTNLGGSVFHGHNELVQLLVTGGRFLALMIGFLILIAIFNAARWARYGENFPAIYLTSLIGACVLEVSFALIDRDFLIPVMVVPLAFVMLAEPPRRQGVEDPAIAATKAPVERWVRIDGRRRPLSALARSAPEPVRRTSQPRVRV